jgi:hypothetical protein
MIFFGSERFPYDGRHLDQRTRSVFPEGFFKVGNRSDPAIPQSLNRQIGELLQSFTQDSLLPYPLF